MSSMHNHNLLYVVTLCMLSVHAADQMTWPGLTAAQLPESVNPAYIPLNQGMYVTLGYLPDMAGNLARADLMLPQAPVAYMDRVAQRLVHGSTLRDAVHHAIATEIIIPDTPLAPQTRTWFARVWQYACHPLMPADFWIDLHMAINQGIEPSIALFGTLAEYAHEVVIPLNPPDPAQRHLFIQRCQRLYPAQPDDFWNAVDQYLTGGHTPAQALDQALDDIMGQLNGPDDEDIEDVEFEEDLQG